MTWNETNIRNTGDLITANIYNDEIMGNLEYLHARVGRIWVPVTKTSLKAYFPVALFGNQSFTYFSFSVPDDFDALYSARAYIIPTTTSGTTQYEIYSTYAAEGEPYNNHSESLINQTKVVILNQIFSIDIGPVLSSLAAGDLVGIGVRDDNSVTDYAAIGLCIEYTRI